ncbi:MAG: substrate-binding domain-containing protein [Bacteroidia bacterium]|nr:substrate-binding domain-containing protein [Bacteroidia bacterium]MDW8158153.1 substrate-binding domain-containing protein [Bacteroidia bacterium]
MKIFLVLILLSIGILSCDTQGPGATISKGKAKIVVDETMQPIIEAELRAFKQQYPKAEIQVHFTTETEAVRLFMVDSAQVALVPRALSNQEKEWFRSKYKFVPKETPFATDAVVLIVHPSNPDSQLSIEQLRKIFLGEIKDWKSLNPKTKNSGQIQVVFDNNRSSLIRFIQDSLLGGKALEGNIYAERSNPGVINYVQNNPNAIGVIGYNWVSDKQDTLVQNYLRKVRMIAIAKEGQNEFVKLDEYVMYKISHKKYPLLRKLYFWNREGKMGPATGFVSYAAGKDGQLIAFKADLLPASEIIRLVEIKEGNIKVEKDASQNSAQ